MKKLIYVSFFFMVLVNMTMADLDFFKKSEGKVFKFRTKELIRPSEKKIQPGKRVVSSRPVPLSLEVTFSGEKEYKGESCYVLDLKSATRNPMAGVVPGQPENSDEYTKAYISKEGQILYEKKITKAGGNTNTNKNWDLPFHATLDFFYGQWMQKLKKDYIYSAKGQNNITEIKVLEINEKNGKEYFKVKYLLKRGDKTIQDIIYWIDAEKRIAIFAKNKQSEMRMVN